MRLPPAAQHHRVFAEAARPAAVPYRPPGALGGAVVGRTGARVAGPGAAPILQLQRSLGNRAVAQIMTRGGGHDVLQRAPIVYNWKTNLYEDAANWNLDTIENWLNWYDRESAFTRNAYNGDYNDLLNLRRSPHILAQQQQRDDPKGYAFDQAKRTQPRDNHRIAAAEAAIDAFENQNHANPAFNFDKARVVTELREVVADPGKMNQKGYPLCGPDTYLRMFAVHHPESYVRFVVALLTTGSGTLGAQTVTAPKSVQEKNLWSTKMRIGEWVAEASLRIKSNTPGYNTIHQGSHSRNKISFFQEWNALIAGATRLGEMKAWFRAADPNMPVTEESYWVTPTPRSIVGRINAAFHAGQAVALAINGGIVGAGYDHKLGPINVGGHLVTLASDILETTDGRNYIGDVLTWGDKKRIVFRYDQLSRAILGFLAVDLAQFNPNPGQANLGGAP